MPDISITVADKIAHAPDAPVIVCGNSDYVLNFTLDSEWDSYDTKTARFEYAADGELKYQDVVFSGLSVSAPIITGAAFVEIGLYAGICTRPRQLVFPVGGRFYATAPHTTIRRKTFTTS